jgi:hypothetical protein
METLSALVRDTYPDFEIDDYSVESCFTLYRVLIRSTTLNEKKKKKEEKKGPQVLK